METPLGLNTNSWSQHPYHDGIEGEASELRKEMVRKYEGLLCTRAVQGHVF